MVSIFALVKAHKKNKCRLVELVFDLFRQGTAVLLTLLAVYVYVPSVFAFAPAPVDAPVEEEQSWWREGLADEGGDAPVYRSPTDDRGYRYLQLDNGLRVLLISDPESDKSAASLDVHVGSFQNPNDREGLAHFLEHMLFLGTEKYPEPGEYQAFISEHGGSHNAYTSLEHTNYFFDVDPKYFESALDRFAQFFVAPRFDEAYVNRERKAVESEFQLKIRDDGRREWEVLSELVNPAHPLSRFSVGNLETLADRDNDPVREDLLAFYRQYYSANLMTLVVLGKEPLDELQKAVVSRFLGVKNYGVEITDKPIALFSIADTQEVRIKPEKERRELSLLFALPSLQRHWRTKPSIFLGHLIGDEGEDSLLTHLKGLGLAEGLSAGLAYDSRHGAAFSINIALTALGLKNYQQVQDESFAWINQVREEGIVNWRYQELANLGQIDFRFLDKSPSAYYVRSLASGMHKYPAEEVLRGPFSYQNFNAELIRKVADYLRPDNVLVSIAAPEFNDLELVSKRYSAPYSKRSLSSDRLLAWSGVAKTTLGLPEMNPYIPESFPVSEKGGKARLPEALVDNEVLTLWHYGDNQFGSPRSIFTAKVLSPSVATRRGTALTSLYLAMVRDQLNAEIYPAFLAGLNFSLSPWSHGIGFSVSGYSDKQRVLMQRVLDVLAVPEWDAGRFDRLKTMLVREWINTRKQWPVQRAFGEVAPVLNGSHRPLDLAEELQSVSVEELQEFVGGLYQQAQVEAYAGGVVDAVTARAMAEAVVSTLDIERPPGESAVYRVIKLKPFQYLPQHSIEVDHADSSAILYLQAAEDSIEARARFTLLQNMIDAPFYTSLRTEKQLGYAVGSRTMPLRRVPGVALYVQSPVLESAEIISEIDGFLGAQQAKVSAMSEEDFSRYQQSVLSLVEQRPKNLMELAGRHRQCLNLDFSGFDFRERLAAAVRGVSRQDLIAVYDELAGEARRGLWFVTRAAGQDDGSEPGGKKIGVYEGSLTELNAGQSYSYPAL